MPLPMSRSLVLSLSTWQLPHRRAMVDENFASDCAQLAADGSCRYTTLPLPFESAVTHCASPVPSAASVFWPKIVAVIPLPGGSDDANDATGIFSAAAWSSCFWIVLLGCSAVKMM